MTITQPIHVWVINICDISMAKGFVYFVAIMDWASRRVLAEQTSNTLDGHFWMEAI